MQRLKRVCLLLVLSVSWLWSGMLRADEAIRVQYKIGEGLNIGDGGSLVHLEGRIQNRYTYLGREAAANTSSFAVQRGEIRIEGFTFSQKLRFRFEMNLATRGTSGTSTVCASAGGTATANCPGGTTTVATTSGTASLNDYYVDWVPSRQFGVQVGQFKVPYLLAQMNSSTKLQFIDRSLGTGFFDFQRDIGVSMHGQVLERRFGYYAFVMNGDGANATNRNNRAVLTGLRLEAPLFGDYGGYLASESDVDNSESPQAGVGIAYAFNEAGVAMENNTIAAGIKAHHGTLDAGYKYHGFSLQGAGMISRAVEGAHLTNWGYFAQAGYFLVPKKVETVAKTSAAIFSNAVVNQFEHSAGFNYFIYGHGIKLQLDYAFLPNSRGQDLNDHRVRTALNLVF